MPFEIAAKRSGFSGAIRLCVITMVMFASLNATSSSAQLSAGSPLLMGKHLVPLGDGRALNLVCIGEGSPTLVFEYGLGSNILHWQKIQEPLSAITRTCFYDRAGYGFSSPARKPMTASNVVSDLHVLLHKSGEHLPVVLVGHSIGGLYATLYTDKFPKEVAGLVLIDSSFAGQSGSSTTLEQQQTDREDYDHEQSEDRRCAALAREGKLSHADPHACFKPSPTRTSTEIAFIEQQYLKPYRYESVISENQNFAAVRLGRDEDSKEETASARPFGDKPVIVLTAGRGETPKGWEEGHDRLAARSRNGESITVPDSGHYIQIDNPEAVIAAVKKVVMAIRSKDRSP